MTTAVVMTTLDSSANSFGLSGLLDGTAGLLGGFMQEILVVAVFFFSFRMWRDRKQKVAKTSASVDKASSQSIRKGKAPVQPSDCRSVKKQAPPVSRSVAISQATSLEAEMLTNLNTRKEFTRALNLYRNSEQMYAHFFSEELYSSFIQSAVRVGKLDVVERMLRAIKTNGKPMSLKFWQTTLRMLSSRKHFSACMNVQTIFGDSLPCERSCSLASSMPPS